MNLWNDCWACFKNEHVELEKQHSALKVEKTELESGCRISEPPLPKMKKHKREPTRELTFITNLLKSCSNNDAKQH